MCPIMHVNQYCSLAIRCDSISEGINGRTGVWHVVSCAHCLIQREVSENNLTSRQHVHIRRGLSFCQCIYAFSLSFMFSEDLHLCTVHSGRWPYRTNLFRLYKPCKSYFCIDPGHYSLYKYGPRFIFICITSNYSSIFPAFIYLHIYHFVPAFSDMLAVFTEAVSYYLSDAKVNILWKYLSGDSFLFAVREEEKHTSFTAFHFKELG